MMKEHYLRIHPEARSERSKLREEKFYQKILLNNFWVRTLF